MPIVEDEWVGVIWGVGTVFNFVAASLAGVAISYAIGQAARFGCAVAGLSVTRRGTAPSMPYRREIDDLMERLGAGRRT